MPDAVQIGPFLIATVRLVLLTGLLVASWWAARVARRAGLDANWVTNTAGNLAIAGLLGARLGFVLLNWDGYQANPITALYVWQPGYLPWAGVMGGMAYAVICYLTKGVNQWEKGMPCLTNQDIPSTILAWKTPSSPPTSG